MRSCEQDDRLHLGGQDLVWDGEDVVIVTGELFIDPEAALTAIGGFVETMPESHQNSEF